VRTSWIPALRTVARVVVCVKPAIFLGSNLSERVNFISIAYNSMRNTSGPLHSPRK
jgi:hypothetical protein